MYSYTKQTTEANKMCVDKLIIQIDNFDNSAMVENLDGEVTRVLNSIIKNYGISSCDGNKLRDSNGNTIGSVEVLG